MISFLGQGQETVGIMLSADKEVYLPIRGDILASCVNRSV